MDVGVQLLGPPEIVVGGMPLGLPPGKTSAALYYLAFERSWVPREDLLLLFWPDREDVKARNNLRQLLTSIRHRAHLEGVEIERSRIRWRVPTDLHELRVAEENDEVERVVEAYRGSLLQGFRLDSAPEFERWLEFERGALERSIRERCLRHAGQLRTRQRLGEAIAVLESLMTTDPFDEQALRLLLQVLGESGRRAEAIGIFERYRQQLEDELGIEPEEESLRLAQALCDTAFPLPGADAGPHSGASPVSGVRTPTRAMPAQATPFVGREKECRDLERFLVESDARLVSIVAPGGMGKTRLSLAVAASLRSVYADGVAFVSFAAITRPEQMASALVQALGLRSLGTDPRGQILGYLADRHMLLVLDNLEHLTDDLSLVSDLLRGCPRVTLLATSRERLALSSEWIYDLRGLECPPEAAERPGTVDAVVYFVQAAKRIRSGAALDLDEVAALCRRVRGMPLALTLAANWLRVLPLSEIVSELERDLGMLASEERDVPERHRSMRSVFDATWERLGAAERRAWAGVAWFEGGFTREAASEVAEVTLPLMMALVNRAITTLEPSGRFDLHPLVRQYGRERAEALGIASTVRDRHARYYAEHMQRSSRAFFGPERKAAEAQADRELANVRAAWDRLLTRHDCARLNPLMVALIRYYWWLKHRIPELQELFGSAVPRLEAAPAGPHQQIALGRAYLFSGPSGQERAAEIAGRQGDAFALAIDRYMRMIDCSATEGREHYAAGVEYCRETGDPVLLSAVTSHYGFVLIQCGHYGEGERLLREAMAILERQGDLVHVAGMLTNLAVPCVLAGDLERAERYLERSRELYRRLGEEIDYSGSYEISAWIELLRGNVEQAERSFERCLAERIALGMVSEEDATLARSEMYAQLRYRTGAYPEALEFARTARQLRISARKRVPMSLLMARCSLRLGDVAGARDVLREAFRVAVARESARLILDAAVVVADILSDAGDSPVLAGALVATALRHPCTAYETKLEIGALTGRLPALPDPGDDHDLTWVEATLERALGGE